MRRRIRWWPAVVGSLVVFLGLPGSVEKSFGAEVQPFSWSWTTADASRESPFLQDSAGAAVTGAELSALVRDARDISFLDPRPTAIFSPAAPLNGSPKKLGRALRYAYENGHPHLFLEDGSELAFGPEIFPLAATYRLLRALGYAVPEVEIVRDFKIAIPGNSLDFARFWQAAPGRTSYRGFVAEIGEGGGPTRFHFGLHIGRVSAGNSLAEILRENGAEKRRELRALSILALWLGSHAFAETGEAPKWERSLGASDYDSSLNLLPTLAVRDPKALRESLGKAGRVELPLFVAPEWQGVFQATTLADARWMIRRLHAFAEKNLEAWLRSSGYPEPAVRILKTRLSSRLNSLALAFAVQNRDGAWLGVLPREELTGIEIPGLVEKGIILREISGFPGALAADPTREWMRRNGGAVAEKLGELIAEMIAHAPFGGLEFPLGKKGKQYIGPGWVLRAEREVRPNPEAKHARELFRIRDSVQVSLFLGLGMNSRLFGQTLWANASPGWTRVYATEHTAPSAAEARSRDWLLALKALRGSIGPNSIAAGESVAVKSGYSANLIVGGNVRAFTKLARGAGYALAGIEWISGTAAERRSDGGLVLIRESSRRGHFAAKAYARAYSRMFRVPVASFDTSIGESEFAVFESALLPTATEKDWIDAFGAWSEAIEDDSVELGKGFHRSLQTMDFSRERGGYNFYFRRGRFGTDSNRETIDSDGERTFLHLSRNEAGSEKRESDQWEGGECASTGIVLYTDASQTKVLDRILESRCSLHDENALPGEAKGLGIATEKALGGRLSLAGARFPEHSPFRVDSTVRIHGRALERLFRLGESEFAALVGSASGSGLEAELLKELREFFATPDESAKMDLLTKWLTRSLAMRFAILRLLDDVELEARIAEVKWEANARAGEVGPALAALRAWSALTGRNLLGDL